jgi:Protein of unknown function (DUF3341)/Cytochrome C oxidase, cbb3-type, subunit III
MSAQQDQDLYGVVAEFDTPKELVAAAEGVRDARFTRWDCFSPYPVPKIDRAMGTKMTILPWLVFGAGVTGCGGALLLQWWTNAYDWPWLTSGKPFFSLPANIPVTFEGTILFAAVGCFILMWALNRLPRFWHPNDVARRFEQVTNDGFFIGIEASDPVFDRRETVALLQKLGARSVELVHLDPDPAKKQIPRPIIAFVVVTAILSIIPFALVARAKERKSDKPHIHVVPDMDFQFKLKSQAGTDLFEDGRSTRPPIPGTVARGELRADDHFYRGIVHTRDGKDGDEKTVDAWATAFPPGFDINPETMKRGRQRYDIFCQPCHGAAGYGDGIIDKRAKETEGSTWSPPTSLHMAHIVTQPHGQIFNTISHGIRTMQGYAGQIAERDRWAIILYVRALQRSQMATAADAPTGALKAPEPAAPAPGAPGPAPAAPAGAPGPAAAPGAAAPGPAGSPAAPGPAAPPESTSPATPPVSPPPDPGAKVAPVDPGAAKAQPAEPPKPEK